MLVHELIPPVLGGEGILLLLLPLLLSSLVLPRDYLGMLIAANLRL
jgi:hypothetical protein